MPIKFRCPHCHQFLGISRGKAGEVSDCPMCGKTLRVPNLDGSVDPLPKPKLNLQDSSLADALGELAGIGATVDSGEVAESQPASRDVVESPRPIELEPAVRAEPLEVVVEPSEKSRVSPSRSPRSAGSDEATMAGLADEMPAIEARPSSSRTSRRTGGSGTVPPWVPTAIAVGLFLMGAVALVMMKDTGSSSEQADGIAENAANEPEDVAPAPGGSGSTSLRGRVTYVSEAGDSRPDSGAKVIVLPKERLGTVMLDTAGFQVGAADVDTKIAAAALTAMGGHLITADERGEYAVPLEDAGDYEILVISRHQSRPWQVGVEEETQESLSRFFLRPSTLLGQLAHRLEDFTYRGDGESVRDFAFRAE